LRIIEVGPRDGLQNEALFVPTEAKLAFIRGLAESGLKEIEAASFVSPKWVPQMADGAELWPQLPPGPLYSALAPNMRGLQTALSVGVQRIALFTAASEEFTRRNINMTIEESLAGFAEMARAFREAVPGGWIRGYVSTVIACPFAGAIEPPAVAHVVERLLEIGVNEISLGETIGVATPREVRRLHQELSPLLPPSQTAWHFHDTRGTALANVAEALSLGAEAFDASAAGLGGCPYAPGAGGNLATDDLVYFLEREGVKTGIDPDRLAQASRPIRELLGRQPDSRALRAWEAGR
jgi:hydroxymethylglutaryl-CoA lyase